MTQIQHVKTCINLTCSGADRPTYMGDQAERQNLIFSDSSERHVESVTYCFILWPHPGESGSVQYRIVPTQEFIVVWDSCWPELIFSHGKTCWHKIKVSFLSLSTNWPGNPGVGLLQLVALIWAGLLGSFIHLLYLSYVFSHIISQSF